MRALLVTCKITVSAAIVLLLLAVLLLFPQALALRVYEAENGALCYYRFRALAQIEPGQHVVAEEGNVLFDGTAVRRAENTLVLSRSSKEQTVARTSLRGDILLSVPFGAAFLRFLRQPAVLIVALLLAAACVVGVLRLPKYIYRPKYGKKKRGLGHGADE